MLDKQKTYQRLKQLQEIFKAYVDLIEKNPAKITKTDKRHLAEWEAELSAVMEPEERSSLLVDAETIASFFGVTRRAVSQWVQGKIESGSRCPKVKRGMYDLKAVFMWWLKEIGPHKNSADAENSKLELLHWKKEIVKTNALKLKGQLIHKNTVDAAWAARMATVCGGLMYLVNRLPPLLEGKSRNGMLDIIEDEVRALREQYVARGPCCGEWPHE